MKFQMHVGLQVQIEADDAADAVAKLDEVTIGKTFKHNIQIQLMEQPPPA